MTKPLKFIHITKCAGTAIENVSKRWGMFDEELGELFESMNMSFNPHWHVPLHYLKDEYLTNILEKYDLFTVVRNPYTRIISEYYCEWGGSPVKSTDINDFNQFIYDKLLCLKKRINDGEYVHHHYTPQYRYLVDKNGNIIIKHMLKMETVTTDFNNLMEKNGYEYRLEEKKGNDYNFSYLELSYDNISLIREIYRWDFEICGYSTKLLPELNSMDVLKMYGIDKIYCINWDKREDRWERMNNRFDMYGLLVERYSTVTVDSDDAKKFSEHRDNSTTGLECCALSHINVLKDARDKGCRYVMVLEDDVRFLDDFIDNLVLVVHNIRYQSKKSIDLLMLDCAGLHFPIETTVHKITDNFLSGGYIMSLDYINKAIHAFEKSKTADIEGVLMKLQSLGSTYTSCPRLLVQESQ